MYNKDKTKKVIFYLEKKDYDFLVNIGYTFGEKSTSTFIRWILKEYLKDFVRGKPNEER